MKLPIKVFVPILAGAVLGAGGLYGVSTMGLLPTGAPKEAAPETAHAQARVGVMFPMRERVVNLADTGILRYLKASIVLEVFDPENPEGKPKGEDKKKEELPKDLKQKAAPMEDRLTAILSAKTSADIISVAGKQRLKEEIRDGLNDVLHEERILAVYFTDFIVQ